MYNNYLKRILEQRKMESDGGVEIGGNGQSNTDTQSLEWDVVKSFLESNDEAKQFLQSRTDAEKRAAVEAFKANKMPELVNAEVLKKTTPDPTQAQLNELKQQIETEKQSRIKSDIIAALSVEAADLNISADVAKEFCIGKDIEDSKAKLSRLHEYINERVDVLKTEEVNKAFANNYATGNQAETIKGIKEQSNLQSTFNSRDVILKQMQNK
ncbi:hypothetical protein HB992_09795 [Listeria seeligeri]|uniref:capsid assembly scaffolding protein Gp46 family protein n=1 Tax=Listeria seeligeri TaxID=1640 RepID=UPI0016272A8E|nr:DUF4355 domain-containing protein [Listeria seeligeri]MBC1734961.1 hypothetical protein [Listeria seeligeri]